MIPHKEAIPFPVVQSLNFEELKKKKETGINTFTITGPFLPIVARLGTSSKRTIRHNEVKSEHKGQ